MRIWLLIFLCVSLSPVAAETQRGTQARTPVTITSFSADAENFRLRAEVIGATRQSQVVVLIRTANRFGLRPAANPAGEPERPKTQDLLPPSEPSARAQQSKWTVTFYSPFSDGRIEELYAIVCETKERTDWPNSRDYKGFMYLPFAKVQSVDEALVILRDFGWIPTGVTRIEP